jgi:hypothetical protein
MSETLTTEQIRIGYIGTRPEFVKPWQAERPDEFDRWLAGHDAEVRNATLSRAAEIARQAEWDGSSTRTTNEIIAAAIEAERDGS